MKPMIRWGVGPGWFCVCLPYFLIAYYARRAVPFFRITDAFYPLLTYLAILLLVIGLPYYVVSIYSVTRAFNAGRLATKGVYGICRHPVYGSWIVFNVPAFALLLHSWLLLTVPVVMYISLRAMIGREEDYLAARFGESYLQYKAEVPLICPVGWLTRKGGM
jgi:protein-S-isoprenylcysteine O-methyltransferase Ste14